MSGDQWWVGVSEQVDREFACPHEEVVLTRFDKANGTCEYRRQCRQCGVAVAVVRKVTLSREELESAPAFDRDLADRWYRAKMARWEALRDERKAEHDAAVAAEREAEDAEWWDRYNAHLESPEWRWRREAVMKRAAGLCEGCRCRRAVHVHHLTYEHVGREFLWELVAVCKPCHEAVHGRELETPFRAVAR